MTVVVFAWAGISFWYYKIYLPSIPPPKEQPLKAFSKLPRLTMQKSAADTSKLNFALDTATGTVDGKFPEIFKVYSVAQVSTDLLALEKAKELAVNLGFKASQQALSSTQYKFFAEGGGDLTIELSTGNFKLNRPIATVSAELTDRESFLDPNKVGSDFKQYLSSKNLLSDSLLDGRVKVIYDKTRGETNKAFISIWQTDINETPIVSDSFSEALVKGIITNYREEFLKYVHVDYTVWPIDEENSSTYPLKTAQEAYDEMQRGNAMVPFATKNQQVSIEKVYLAYYLPVDYTAFLQPVYVFEGPEFAAYVQAIKNEDIEE